MTPCCLQEKIQTMYHGIEDCGKFSISSAIHFFFLLYDNMHSNLSKIFAGPWNIKSSLYLESPHYSSPSGKLSFIKTHVNNTFSVKIFLILHQEELSSDSSNFLFLYDLCFEYSSCDIIISPNMLLFACLLLFYPNDSSWAIFVLSIA